MMPSSFQQQAADDQGYMFVESGLAETSGASTPPGVGTLPLKLHQGDKISLSDSAFSLPVHSRIPYIFYTNLGWVSVSQSYPNNLQPARMPDRPSGFRPQRLDAYFTEQ